MLRLAEEILLLALDEKTGRLHALPERALEFALAGAVIMELVLGGRLKTDAARLRVVDALPTGDLVLDEALRALPPGEPDCPIAKALARVALRAGALQEQLFASLVRRGILAQTEEKFLWVLRERRHPVVDDREEREVRARLREIVLDPGVAPDERDIVLIGLIEACELSPTIFTPAELARTGARLEQIARQNSVMQALAAAIDEIQQAVLEVIAYSGM